MPPITVGGAVVDDVAEQSIPIPLRLITDDETLLTRVLAHLPDGFMEKESMTFQFSSHSWLVKVDELTVLIDPCTGNGRTELGPLFDNLDEPFLERLSQAGARPDTVDIVFCTHLHHDHCGWNTMLVDGAWIPTFPNARYLFVAEEHQRWNTANPGEHPNDFNPNTFDHSVRPIFDAGLAEVISTPYALSPSLTIESAPGHTVGHSMVRLESEGAIAYFTGDAFHHPIQLTRPELHLSGCDDLTAAIVTRRKLAQRALDEDAFLFPAHFSAPHYGQLTITDDEVHFVPGGAPSQADGIASLGHGHSE